MLMLWLFLGNASATDWSVGGNAGYATVTEVLPLVKQGDTIIIAPGDYDEDVVFDGITDLTVRGAGTGPQGTTFGGGETTAAWAAVGASNLTIEDLEIHPDTDLRAFLVSTQSTNVTLRNVRLTGGAQPEGGGLSITDSSVTVENCQLDSNQAEEGGGIHASGGAITVINSVFLDNGADAGGHFFCASDTTCVVEDSLFVGGSASSGAGIYAYQSDLTLIRNRFCSNYGFKPPRVVHR